MLSEGTCYESRLTPSFAAGQVYLPDCMDSLLCQSYYNTHIIPMVQQMAGGGGNDTLMGPSIFHADIPQVFIGRRYGQLFRELCSRGIICMGLYRLNAHNSPLPYHRHKNIIEQVH